MTPEESEKLLKIFARHLVVCSCPHRLKTGSDGKEHPWKLAVFSGIVMTFGDEWYCATAGHCLNDFRALYDRDDIEMDTMTLADHFSQDTDEPAHIFNLTERQAVLMDDESEGLDFGFVRLTDFEVKGMIKSGIIPLTEDKWMPQDKVVFDRYFLLGSPAELCDVIDERCSRTLAIAPTLLGVTLLNEQPQVHSNVPWLSFQISDKIPIKSIKGMSGGPVFGIRYEGTGWRYWIAALQIFWNEDRRIAYACRLPEFGRLFQAYLAMEREHTGGSS